MINRVVLVGRLTKDVEVRKTTTGLSVASFTVACDRRGQKNPDGSSQADFINCTAWRQSADFLGQYARKGAMVGVEGRIQTRSYDDQQGQRRYVTEVVCDNVSLLESKSQSMARAQQSNDYSNSCYGQQSYQQPYQQQYQPQQPYQPAGPSNSAGDDPFGASPLDIASDDLPF